MTGVGNERNLELEMAKLKLNGTKQIISDTQDKIQQMEAEHQTNNSQHYKKMKNLNNVEATQYLKMTKLDSDIDNVEKVLQSRLVERESLVKMTAEYEREIVVVKQETVTMIADFQQKCREMEEGIKTGYLQIQTDRDMEVLLEMAQYILKDDEKLPYVHEILNDRREAIFKRRQELNRELTDVERIQNDINTDIRARQQDLEAKKEKYSALTDLYRITRKLKKGH